MSRTEVHKFGGTSVGSTERIREAARLVQDASAAAQVVAVTSAMGGVTDELVRAAEAAAGGDRNASLEAVAHAVARNLETLAELGVEDRQSVGEQLKEIGRELAEIVRATVLLGELTPRSRDRLLSSGEKLAARLLAAQLRHSGADAVAVDADTFLETNGRFGEADPLVAVADRSIRAALGARFDAGCIPVVTGFCGRGPDGATTTLGRGGSDLSATFIAAALGADEVVIWTDVDGVFSADPRMVPEARAIRHLHYREATEMSFYGAKVLHQRSMIPLVGAGLPARIRNSFAPEAEGTLVDSRHTPGSHPVKAISAIRSQALLSIEGKGMAGLPGVAARVFRALADGGVNVTMISQSSSESTICIAVSASDVATAETALKREFRAELSRGEVEEIDTLTGVGLVAAVGLGMAHVPGIAARLFRSLADHRVNVLAIAQGSSELNISLAVAEEQAPDAVRAIHREFGLHRRDTGDETHSRMDLILMGLGNVGRCLSEMIRHDGAAGFHRLGREARIVAVADRSGYLMRPAGIPSGELDALARGKEQGRAISTHEGACSQDSAVEIVRAVLDYRLARPVLIDVSDADTSDEAFLEAFRNGCDVVTANKKPLTVEPEQYRRLLDDARAASRELRAEATVGAGLPVLDTLEMLLATGDEVSRAEGCMSGTLGFLIQKLEDGVPFSEAVADAAELGYTEPDPVADLSGADVARKALILGRLSGLAESREQLTLEGLVGPELAGLDRATLIRRLAESHDGPLAERVAAARERGRALRFVARVERDSLRVGLEEVDPESALGMLRGTDNTIAFYTRRYTDRPLVVTGPGAGVEVTAMGVLGDVLRIAAVRR
ncbi:MAG: bifunctional aspartate kinase/homoserine dehydrogenase I [bacterium]|nr:bifunctional aspartate kinase/homoserine dehydrogenase I [bacterium]